MDNSNKPSSFMLTTIDNPYNPFTQFDEWYQFDIEHGYDTCSYFARISELLKEDVELESLDNDEKAMNLIVDEDPIGLYVKVKSSYYEGDKWSKLSRASSKHFETFKD